jgi:imidazolonepropionase-like amidohydrolase
LLLAGCVGGGERPAGEAATLYENGRVWTGNGFETRPLAVAGGRFVDPGRARVATRVDLGGRWVVPPYANAHAHITDATDAASARYLKDGVFYVWNPNTITMSATAKAFFARADTYDVAVAQGGITERGGHPERLYVDYLSAAIYDKRPREWFVGNAFHYGETRAEIDRSLDALRAQGADFVKAYLLHSEDWAARRADKKFYGQRGLDPRNLPYLVGAARKRGLWVAAHVETAADLRVAAASGVAVAAHVPGYNEPIEEAGGSTNRLTEEDARIVARSGMAVVPTYSVASDRLEGQAKEGKVDARLRDATFALQRDNLRKLKAAGVRLLVGTDGWGPIFGEPERWVALGAFTPAEAARATLSTGARLFPERRIGCFARGCEADFLVLDGDPTADIASLRKITRRVKAGREVVAAP